jgi:hypothetical protein
MKVTVKTEVKPVGRYELGDVVVINETPYIIFKESSNSSDLKNRYSARSFDGRTGSVGMHPTLEALHAKITSLPSTPVRHYPQTEYELQLVKKEEK